MKIQLTLPSVLFYIVHMFVDLVSIRFVPYISVLAFVLGCILKGFLDYFLLFFFLNYRNKISNHTEERLSDLNLLSDQLETTENTETNDID